MAAVDGNRGLDPAILQGQPETVPLRIVAQAELRQLARDLAFKRQAKAGQPLVAERVQFDDAADGARQMALMEGDGHGDESRSGCDTLSPVPGKRTSTTLTRAG